MQLHMKDAIELKDYSRDAHHKARADVLMMVNGMNRRQKRMTLLELRELATSTKYTEVFVTYNCTCVDIFTHGIRTDYRICAKCQAKDAS